METASCLLGRSTEAEILEAAVVAWMELMPVLVKASTRDSALLHALFKVRHHHLRPMRVSMCTLNMATEQEVSKAALECCHCCLDAISGHAAPPSPASHSTVAASADAVPERRRCGCDMTIRIAHCVCAISGAVSSATSKELCHPKSG